VVPTPANPAELITAVFTSTIDAEHAPNPGTSAERFVFGHAYEPLLRVSCSVAESAGLAKSWTPLDGRQRWRVVLRDDARFWNGDRVTAGDVLASWRSIGQAPTAVTARRMADLTMVVDDTTLEIRLGPMPLTTLGNPELAVARRTPQARWPEGTGRYRIQDVSERRTVPQRSSVMLEPVRASGMPRVAVNLTTPSDGRDLVDAGADLIITDDRSLSAYRTARPGVTSNLLEAPQTWLLVTHVPLTGDSGAATDAARTADIRASLAQYVVRAQARPASSARWFPGALRCDPFGPPQPPARGSRPSTRIVYRRGEPIAQALAERLVALAASADTQLSSIAPDLGRAGARATAVALEPNDFDAALRSGRELGYVVSVTRTPIGSCCDTEVLVTLAPWLAGSPGAAHFAGVVAPLIETRPVAVMIPGRAGFALSGDGSIIVAPQPPAAARSP